MTGSVYSNYQCLRILDQPLSREGRAIGQKIMFVETAGCDYHCDWCDSASLGMVQKKPTHMTLTKSLKLWMR